MEGIIRVVYALVVELGKFMCKCIYPNIENTVHFSSNVENLREETEKLTKFRDDTKGKVEVAEGKGYKPKPNVIKWIEDVNELENEWETMQESIASAKTLAYMCCPNCILRSEVSTQAKNIRDQLCKLKEVGENFESNLMVENYRMEKVEHIPVTPIEGQLAATRNLQKILQLLEDDKVCIIGVWGTGGVGKTTLVKNLNNELRKPDASRSKLFFGVVVWITVPKPPINIREVQEKIANRLNLREVDNKESEESNASKIYRRLKEEKSFLLILDDVWEPINLEDVGVPQPEYPARSKVIITSRLLSVCRQMKPRTDTELNVFTLEEDESWQLFVKNAGDVANLEDIQPLARQIARECGGLPLAITVIGASMSGKEKVELWKDTLKSLRMSEPHDKVVEYKVYKVIKYSFNALVSRDIELSLEQRSNMTKRRGDIQSCFLYCSLYPEAIPTDDLINCWWAEGFLGEHDTHEEAYNRGLTMIESLTDACLLEAQEKVFLKGYNVDCVKMHDVVRDVARWIANSSGNEQNSVFEAGVGLTEISHIKMSSTVKRISFVSNKIKRLPDCFMKCPETTSLLLQDNESLEKIPHEFFRAFPALRVLNLSRTGIRALPSSIDSLCQLGALILRNCYGLKELPPIGNLCNLQVLDCDKIWLHCPPQGMDKLTNLRLLNMSCCCFGPASFDELLSLHKLTSLFINLDSSSIINIDYTWMNRLKTFIIEIGETREWEPVEESTRMIKVCQCETFSNGELSGLLQLASELHLGECGGGLRKLIVNKKSFNGLKCLIIAECSCDFGQVEEGSGQFDPLPNLENLVLHSVHYLKSVSDFSQLLGLRFSKLRQLDIEGCDSLTCLFNNTGGASSSVPKHFEEISISLCFDLVDLFVQCSSSSDQEATLVESEIPRVRKLVLDLLPNLARLGEPESTWQHLEELDVNHCNEIRKLPLSIQTSKNIKVIKGTVEWWSRLEWDDDKFKSDLEQRFLPQQW